MRPFVYSERLNCPTPRLLRVRDRRVMEIRNSYVRLGIQRAELSFLTGGQ